MLFDQYNLPNDIFEVVFATEQQVQVGRLLFEEFKAHGGEMGKTEMSLFATKLHEGTVVETEEVHGPVKRKIQTKISYNKRQFYDRILTPMKAMGLIGYDLYKKRYKLSDGFNKTLQKVGVMWMHELSKKQGF
ncbi:TPA: hypothetical protein HA249_02260 [Candidatus Woesearchaeota archaeon]|nr:hypothetical protein [Candidatus Woesearchaeota archaeon]HII89106.1 hypothetical protein [Candidatus Woesearchaeota archaeon]